MKKRDFWVRVMMFWTLWIGVGAVFGGTAMLLRPDGSLLSMQAMLPYFQVLPLAELLYQDYVFPGIALLIVNGATNLCAAVLLQRRKRAGVYLGCAFGVTLMLWITIQFVIFPMNILSTMYFLFGALQFACGVQAIIAWKQSEFTFDPSRYTRIGTDMRQLVVYYSRLGYTRAVAYELANARGAALYEVKTPERTQGFSGFAWLGRFGMHRWAMPIEPVQVDVTAYQNVVLVTPVHVFTVAAPMRAFCQACQGQILRAELVCVHFRKDSDFTGAFAAMEQALGIQAASWQSVVCKFGRVVARRCLR